MTNWNLNLMITSIKLSINLRLKSPIIIWVLLSIEEKCIFIEKTILYDESLIKSFDMENDHLPVILYFFNIIFLNSYF